MLQWKYSRLIPYVAPFQESELLDLRFAIVKDCLFVCLSALIFLGPLAAALKADELILDESMTEFHEVGDFDVSTCIIPVKPEADGLLNENGEISTGKLYKYFKSKGITSVHELVFCVDVDPAIKRTDYFLNSIVLSIEDSGSYTLGENSLKLPAYEASALKPEAQLAVKLEYDFMQVYNENSTQRIKLDIGGVDKSSFKIGVVPQTSSSFPVSRFLFLTAFAGFWLIVFVVLFRATTPRSPTDMASPA